MKIQDTFTVISSEKKSGTSNSGHAWERTEYLLKNILERDDGSLLETFIVADASQRVGELKINGEYKATVFVTSRKYEKDGKTTHFPSFRVTAAELIGEQSAATSETPAAVDQIGDDIPF